MKKFKAISATLIICLLLLSSTWPCVTASAAKEVKTYTILDFILLNKYLVGEYSNDDIDFDYNKDGRVNTKDLLALKALILNPSSAPTVPDKDQEDSKFDGDGYYNYVVKP